MAIFGKSKKEEVQKKDVAISDTKAAAPTSKPVAKPARPGKNTSSVQASSMDVLLAPRVTEKAAILSDSGVYVFRVTPRATKPQIARAIIEMFKVTPVKVRVVNVKGTRVTTRATGKKGRTDRIKKAYVYLKKGEKIELA